MFCMQRSCFVRNSGAYRSTNVGISSKNWDENSQHRKSKVSWATQIVPGLVDPKVSLCLWCRVADGYQVNIPELLWDLDEGRFSKLQARFWLYASNLPQGRECKSGAILAIWGAGEPRKSLRVNFIVLVPQTDTGGRVEYTKVYGRTLV